MRRGRWSEICCRRTCPRSQQDVAGSKGLQGFPLWRGFPLWQFQVALLSLGYPASVIKKMRRTIERRLIRTLHLVARSIPKIRIGCLNPTGDGERPASSRCDLSISGKAVVDRARFAIVSAGACGRDERPRDKRLEALKRSETPRISRCTITSEPRKAAKMQSVSKATLLPLMVMIT